MGVQAGPTAPQFRVFNWPGLDWTPGIVVGQWLWAVFGLGLILLSAVWFARFDPSREGLRRARGKPEEAKEGEPAAPRKKAPRIALPSLSPLVSKLAQVNPFLGVLFAELRLLLNGRRWWWWARHCRAEYRHPHQPALDDEAIPAALCLAVAAGRLVWDGQPRAEEQHLPDGLLFRTPGAASAAGCLAGWRSGDGAF